jgi:O-methyltransferase domain
MSDIEFVAGSFFERVPAGDVYLLATILHDWNDDSATKILRTIRGAGPEHARLVILDAVVPPGNEPFGPKWLDLLMLTLFAGRERDEEQWRVLLAAGGFEPVRFDERLIEARCLS